MEEEWKGRVRFAKEKRLQPAIAIITEKSLIRSQTTGHSSMRQNVDQPRLGDREV